ncbi:hypothetical protein ACWDRX_28750, partial [Streptomyces nigra]
MLRTVDPTVQQLLIALHPTSLVAATDNVVCPRRLGLACAERSLPLLWKSPPFPVRTWWLHDQVGRGLRLGRQYRYTGTATTGMTTSRRGVASTDIEVQQKKLQILRLREASNSLQLLLGLAHEPLDFDLGAHLQAGTPGRCLVTVLLSLSSKPVDVL